MDLFLNHLEYSLPPALTSQMENFYSPKPLATWSRDWATSNNLKLLQDLGLPCFPSHFAKVLQVGPAVIGELLECTTNFNIDLSQIESHSKSSGKLTFRQLQTSTEFDDYLSRLFGGKENPLLSIEQGLEQMRQLDPELVFQKIKSISESYRLAIEIEASMASGESLEDIATNLFGWRKARCK